MEVDQHADLEELVAKGLHQVAAVIAVLGHHGECRAAHHVARVHAARGIVAVPETVVAVAVLEIGEEPRREGQRFRGAPPGRETDAREVTAAEGARLVERQEGHDRDALVLDLVVLQHAAPEVGRHERLQQVLPVQRQRCLLDLPHQRDVLLAIAEIRGGDEATLGIEELYLVRAMGRLAGVLPRGRIGPAEAVHRLHRVGQRQVARDDLEGEERDVHVVEKDEPHALHREIQRRRALPKDHARPGDVVTAKDVQARGRFCVGLAESVQEALHIGQEIDELAIAQLARIVIDQQVILHRLPRPGILRQRFPRMREAARAAQPPQLQRPQQHVAELADDLVFRGGHGEVFYGVASATLVPQNLNRGQTTFFCPAEKRGLSPVF